MGHMVGISTPWVTAARLAIKAIRASASDSHDDKELLLDPIVLTWRRTHDC